MNLKTGHLTSSDLPSVNWNKDTHELHLTWTDKHDRFQISKSPDHEMIWYEIDLED